MPLPLTPPAVEYAALLARYMALADAGQAHGPEGRTILKAMDGPWLAMSEAERDAVG